MAENSITIRIENAIGKNSGVVSNDAKPTTAKEAQEKTNPSSNQTLANFSKVKAIGAVAMAGKQMFSYATSNVGKWTGNSQNQRAVNDIQQLASMGILAYLNPYAAIATVGVKVATTIFDENFDRYWNEKRQANARAIAGYNSQNEIVGRRH